MEKLNSENLKAHLWDTLLKLRAKEIPANTALAISSQAREIMRVVNAEMKIAAANGETPSKLLIGTNNLSSS